MIVSAKVGKEYRALSRRMRALREYQQKARRAEKTLEEFPNSFAVIEAIHFNRRREEREMEKIVGDINFLYHTGKTVYINSDETMLNGPPVTIVERSKDDSHISKDGSTRKSD